MSGTRNPNLGTIAGIPTETTGEEWRQNLGQTKLHLGQPRSADWWTGVAPEQCAGIDEQGKLHSLPLPNLDTCTRQEVLDYFNNSWTLSELLFSALIGDEPFYRPPYHALRHPLIFYYVHPAVLYVNKLRVAGLRTQSLNPFFESLFETGVDEMSWDDMSKNLIEWPSIDQAHQYRAKVYEAVKEVIQTHEQLSDGHRPITVDDALWALFMGFEHERIHIETSSVLIRELPVHLVAQPQAWPDLPAVNQAVSYPPQAGYDYPCADMRKIPATTVSYGKARECPVYGWDNEYGTRTCRVGDFEVGRYLVSNGEFWHFVAGGGYHQGEYWTETGWRWRSFRNVKWPTFWVPDGPAGSNQFKLRTCFEIIPMQWNWPAVVNYHEARAFCNWMQAKTGRPYRLLTEAEHHALRLASQASYQVSPAAPYNINLRFGSEGPVEQSVNEGAETGDLFGNVWQWCEDHFHPLEGFHVHRYYDDFSTPCFDGQHQMIMGGSFVSTGAEASPLARFHFRPHFFQHAGFRVVSSAESDGAVVHLGVSTDTGNPYETEQLLQEYMTLHYGSPETQMPYSFGPRDAASFPIRCADLLVEWAAKLGIHTGTALDVGCAVGGASFRLAQTFDRVIGVDLSEQFVKAARQLQSHGELLYKCKIEGDIFSTFRAVVPQEAARRVTFRQADACSLPPEYVELDAVLMANLLCRLPSPGACLGRMGGSRGLVAPGGLLVIVSPYTWMERFTPKEVWLGGFIDEAGNEQFSQDGLNRFLRDDFDLLDTREMPLIIREHRRKYQYIVAQATVWRRKLSA